jgi:hypothetical protein
MKKVDLSDLKVGDNAWSAMHGYVTVSEKNHQFIRVEIKKGFSTYYVSGNFCDSDTHPTLFHSEQEFRDYWGLGEKLEVLESNTLTKREQFAMALMQPMMANPSWEDWELEEMIKAVLIAADALITKLNEKP